MSAAAVDSAISVFSALWITLGKSNGIPAGQQPERVSLHALPTTDMHKTRRHPPLARAEPSLAGRTTACKPESRMFFRRNTVPAGAASRPVTLTPQGAMLAPSWRFLAATPSAIAAAPWPDIRHGEELL